MSKQMTKPMKIDQDAWARNLHVAPDAPATDDAVTRWVNNYFAFWAICPAKACARTKRCAGDADACRERFWPHVPQRMKFEFHATLKAIHDGLPLEGVMHKVKEEMARFDETTRVLESLGAPSSSPSPLPHGPSKTGVNALSPGEGKAARGPRVRLC